jgi:ABC-2 type transport system ATP-binding protein
VSSVEVDQLVVRYGDLVAVDGVSFTAEAGEVTAVLGPNGAGKTSTIEVCEGFRQAESGRVRVLGMRPDHDQRALAQRIGVMLQDGGVYPSARVRDVVRLYCELYGKDVRPRELIEQVGLTGQATSTWRRMSGGERQRLLLALALAARPEVAFLDEPTSGVDVNGRATIRQIIADLAASGCAVVLATHELDEAERVADRAVIIDRGRVVADGSLAELRSGHDEVRFRSAETLDVAGLSSHLGLPVEVVAPGDFRIGAPSEPQLVARLTTWLAAQGLPLDDLRAGAQRLEDVFLRLTGVQEAPPTEAAEGDKE